MKLVVFLTAFCSLAVSGYAQDSLKVGRDSIIKESGCEFPATWKARIDLNQFFIENFQISQDLNVVDYTGTVFVKALITKEGNLDSIRIAKGPKQPELQILNEEAIRAVKSIPNGSFVPVELNAKPEPEWIVIPVRFQQ